MPDLSDHAVCPTCGGTPGQPYIGPPSWVWLPNADTSRLHAIQVDHRLRPDADGRYPMACGRQHLAVVPVTGDRPPKCRRCLSVVESGEVTG